MLQQPPEVKLLVSIISKKPLLLRKSWTTNEDAIMKNIIDKNGRENWAVISSNLIGRTGKQCRERWHNHLLDGINKGSWTDQEDGIILSTQESLGNRWSKISKLLLGRTENQVKNRFTSLKRSEKHDEKLSWPPSSSSIDIASLSSFDTISLSCASPVFDTFQMNLEENLTSADVVPDFIVSIFSDQDILDILTIMI